MKVILLQDIYKQGVAGEIVDVADGFARNYLIPRGMARRATDGAIKSHQKLMQQVEARRASYENMLNDLARQIDGVELLFERRAASTGTLFGSVTTQEIADALDEKTGVDINRRRISQQALRELGEFEVPVRLGSEISPVLKVVIVREGELEEFLAAREAAAEGEVIDPAEFGVEDVEVEIESEFGPEDVDTNLVETDVIPESVAQEALDRADAEVEEDNTNTSE